MTCNECIHRSVCYRKESVNVDYADKCGDFSLPSAQPEQKWIPVTDNTLPDEGKVVIALGEKGTWDFGTYRGHGDNIHYWYWKKNTYKNVYWWMYKEGALPEPYKPEEE